MIKKTKIKNGGHLQAMLTSFRHLLYTYYYLHLHFLPYEYYFCNLSKEKMLCNGFYS